jgi:HAE1 family hydrophobic/amphiphilic exporter-1
VWAYRPVLGWALRHRILTIGVAVLIVAGAVALLPRIGKEFMPPLTRAT